MARVGLRPPERWNAKGHAYWVLNDSLLEAMRRLGQKAQRGGVDARDSAYWTLLEHQDAYTEGYETGRVVELDSLSPQLLYDRLCVGNVSRWREWSVQVGASREVTDDYGQPAWESRIWVYSPDGELAMFSGIYKSTAREIYRHIVGCAYVGPCTLGDDPPHPAEGCGGTYPCTTAQQSDWLEWLDTEEPNDTRRGKRAMHLPAPAYPGITAAARELDIEALRSPDGKAVWLGWEGVSPDGHVSEIVASPQFDSLDELERFCFDNAANYRKAGDLMEAQGAYPSPDQWWWIHCQEASDEIT
jgi:hypothetical protein